MGRSVLKRMGATLLALFTTVGLMTAALAAGGPGQGSSTASVTGTGDYSANNYSFGYSYNSTYHGSLSSERPNTQTDGAAASVSFSGNSFTFSATSAAGSNPWGDWWDYSGQNVSTETTITNNSGKTLTIGYTYSVNSNGTINGSDLAAGSGTLTWLPGQAIGFMVKTTVTNWAAASSTATATFKITSCAEVNNYDLSIHPTQFGSYTYAIGADPVNLAPGADAYTGQASASTTIKCTVPVLSDTYKNSYVFYGWSVNGVVTASSADYEAAVTTHTTIFPVIVKKDTVDSNGRGPFYVNGNYYVFWKAAFEAAGTSHTVILARDYALPTTLEENGLIVADGKYVSGTDGNLSYQVPTNTKFLIPFSGDFTESFTSEPTNIFLSLSEGVALFDEGGITKRNSTYVTLTVPSGVKIDCYGNINVNGQRQKNGQPYAGVALGKHGRIILGAETASFTQREESAIETQLILRDGAALYCYGYITGTGMVDAKDGSKIHEFIQICDWPGGSNAFNWNNASKTGFLLTQYYVQNIEAPLKVNYGAVCYIETVTTQSDEQKTASSPYINTKSGGTGMFLLNKNAYVLRIYDHTNDRMQYHLKGGTVDFGNISVTFKYLWDVTISSQDYILALNGHYSIYVENGTTLNIGQKISILPGAEVITQEGSTVNLTNQLYIWDVNDWKESYMFSRAYDDDSYYNDGYTMTNKQPNHNALPYVATLNNVSPRTNGLVRLKDGTGETYFMDAINYTDSGRVEINGTLNISGSGSLCTTAGAGTDKCVKGDGTIAITSTPAAGELKVGYSGTITTITAVAGLGNIIGATNNPTSFATATYYGLGDYGDGTLSSDGKTNNYANYWHTGAAQVVNGETYETLQKAIAACSSDTYVQMLAPTKEEVTVSSDIYVDLNGWVVTVDKLTENTTTVNGETVQTHLYFMDKTTDGFTDGTGRVICATGVVPASLTKHEFDGFTRQYVAIQTSTGYAFPRVATTLSGIGIRSNAAGSYLTYQNTFRGGPLATSFLTDMGFDIDSEISWFVENGKGTLTTEYSADSELTSYTVQAHYDMSKPTQLPTSVRSKVELNNEIVTSTYPTETQLKAVFEALGLN